MAYNFPVGYQPAQIYYPTQNNAFPMNQNVTQAQPAQQQNASIIWVQGEAGAKSYLVAPNQTVQLWDSESQTIYLKSADASGMPSIRTLDYTIREDVARSPKIEAQSDFATKDDVEYLKGEIKALKAKLERSAEKGRRKNDE